MITLAACPIDTRPQGAPRLWGSLKINLVPGSLAARVYGSTGIEETFTCNYELNPLYRETLEKRGLRVSGSSDDGGARIIELADYRFFLATGFVPQMSSQPDSPHPLITAFLEAAVKKAC